MTVEDAVRDIRRPRNLPLVERILRQLSIPATCHDLAIFLREPYRAVQAEVYRLSKQKKIIHVADQRVTETRGQLRKIWALPGCRHTGWIPVAKDKK